MRLGMFAIFHTSRRWVISVNAKRGESLCRPSVIVKPGLEQAMNYRLL